MLFRSVSEWFPQRERAFATGVFNGGSNFGQILAPLVIPVVLTFFLSWQYVFVLSFFLSAIWLVLWLLFFRTPLESRFVNAAEREYINSGHDITEKVNVPWKRLVKYPQTWVVAL